MFKKENFKNGMVIELDTGDRRLFWDGRFVDHLGYISLFYYDDNLNNIDRIHKDENINKIFTVKDIATLGGFLRDENLTEIWSRY